MNRLSLLMTALLASAVLSGQTYQQANIVLDSEIPKDKSCVYEASTSIVLLPGLRCEPQKNAVVAFTIDRFGIFPPDEGLLGGPPLSGHDGVVGTLPGELDVNDYGGAMYSIPVMMPQGIEGMEPDIAITYNSQAGNGMMGWGWNLTGLSSITRTGKTIYHDGAQTAVNFTDDRFMMDGQRLMLCDGGYGANGSVYKTEIDEMSKIVAYTNGYSGPGYFLVYKKDGTIWEYGRTDDSRVEPQNRNDVVLKWLVNKISDRDGNSVLFKYYENQSTGESYVSQIDYTINENAGIKLMYRVIFNYVDREDAESGYVFANLVQNKRILSGLTVRNMMTGKDLYNYSFGYANPGSYSDDYRFLYYRLTSIGLTANGLKLNPTRVNWNKKSAHYSNKFQTYTLSKNTFNKVPFTGDFNGDGYTDVITVPYKSGNTYAGNVQAEVHLNNGDGTFDNNSYYTFDFDSTLEWLYIADFDGNGLDDVIPYFRNDDENGTWRGKMKVYLNNGSAFSYLGEKSNYYYNFTLYPGMFCGENKVSFFLDYATNDNYGINTPQIVYYNNGSIVMQSLGDAANQYDPERIIVADINGDGNSEIMYFMNDVSSVAQLTKSNNTYVFNTLYANSDFDSNDYIFIGDFNGDGYTDFLKYDNVSYWGIAYSNGERLTTPVPCYDNNLLRGITLLPQDRYSCSLENLSTPSLTIRTADFDGDGKTDVAVFKNTGGNYYMTLGLKMYKTAGNTYDFNDIRRFYFNINYGHQYVHVGNFLGQENASILSSVKINPAANEYPKIVALNPHTSKYCVERITDGLGNMHGFSYEYLMPYKNGDFYEYSRQWLNNELRTLPIPARALCEDTVISANGHPCVTKYYYKNALYHNKGNGLLGFEKITRKNMINNQLYTIDEVLYDMDLISASNLSVPKSHFKYNFNGQLISAENYSYNVYTCSRNSKVKMPLLNLKKTFDYDYDKANSLIMSKIEGIDYQGDMSGNNYSDVVNVYRKIVGTDHTYTGDDAQACAHRSVTEYSYGDNLNQWIISRPVTVVKSEYYEDNDVVGSSDIYQYSSGKPLQITQKVSLPNSDMNYADPLKIVTDYEYDAVGHVIKQSQSSPSAKSEKIVRLDYGEEYNYLFPTTSINENGWEVRNTFDKDYGVLNAAVDYNQFETNFASDPFEITVEKSLPDGLKSVKIKRWAAGNEHAPEEAMYYSWEKMTGKAETMSFYSKSGNVVRDVTFGLNGEAVYVDYSYDDYGNVISKSMPYIAGDDVRNYYYVYDKNNRLVQESQPNGLVKRYIYDGLQKTVSSVAPDGNEQTTVEIVNPQGWRIATVDHGGNVINYSYYSDGKMKSAMIGDNVATKVEYEYDNRRNLSRMADQASGESLFEYNAYDELVWKKTASNCETAYSYDMMGNLLSRVESGEGGKDKMTTQWVYDGEKGKVGTLSEIVYGDIHRVRFDYDKFLRVSKKVETIEGRDYPTCYEYDGAGRETVVSYPSGVMVEKQYSNTGYYRSMIDLSDQTMLWRSNAADATGCITDYQVGNGLATQRMYDELSNYLSGIVTQKDGKVYQNLTYSYDAFGNLTNRTRLNGAINSESFEYDKFNRLVGIKINGKNSGSMDYDEYGNIHSKVVDNKRVFYDAQYNESCPYAVSRVKTDMSDLSALNQDIEYTVFDKMSAVVSGDNLLTIDYGYDHSRIHSVENAKGKLKEKVYVDDCELVNDNGQYIAYTYLKGPMGVFAVYSTDKKMVRDVAYVHPDHLGSWCLITDRSGKIIQDVSYDAWGNPSSDKLFCDRGFTGHEHYARFGIINMNGRAYDPMMSMMMSPDSQIQNPYFSQNFNRYLYCFNNPLSYYDPTGESVEWLCYALFSATVNVIVNWENIDSWSEGLLSFGAGFVQGSLLKGFTGFHWGIQVISSLTGNTLTDCANTLIKQNIDNRDIDWSILTSRKFKQNMWYSIGSNMATSVLSAYIVQPTDDKAGVSISSMVGKTKAGKMAVEKTTAQIMGNIFSGNNMFEGMKMNLTNVSKALPYIKNIYDLATEGVVFTGRSETLGKVFDKVLNFEASKFFSKMGDDMDYCYSQIRSLFSKTDKP